MIPFPKWMFELLVYGSIGLTAVGVIMLGVLLARDVKGKRLW